MELLRDLFNRVSEMAGPYGAMALIAIVVVALMYWILSHR
jgi:hypothetical protein